MSSFTESVVEDAALAWLEALAYAILHGPDIAVRMFGAERIDPDHSGMVPKTLFSGELRVKDAERQVAETAA